jgi:hypothetical protein
VVPSSLYLLHATVLYKQERDVETSCRYSHSRCLSCLFFLRHSFAMSLEWKKRMATGMSVTPHLRPHIHHGSDIRFSFFLSYVSPRVMAHFVSFVSTVHSSTRFSHLCFFFFPTAVFMSLCVIGTNS